MGLFAWGFYGQHPLGDRFLKWAQATLPLEMGMALSKIEEIVGTLCCCADRPLRGIRVCIRARTVANCAACHHRIRGNYGNRGYDFRSYG